MNQMHRVFLGWLHGEVENKRVPAARAMEDMKPIDLDANRDLFDRFLSERNLNERWEMMEREYGPIQTLTYFNG